MTLALLDEPLRAVEQITGHRELVMIGSQALHARRPRVVRERIASVPDLHRRTSLLARLQIVTESGAR